MSSSRSASALPSGSSLPVNSGSASSGAPASSAPASSVPASSSLSIAQSAAAGLATITQPPQTATSFFKLAQNEMITFGWNYSYVLVTPTFLTISAVGDNGNTYPVGPDPSGRVPGTQLSVVWDVYSYQQAHPNTPLAQGTYNLRMWDDRGPTAVRAPGYLTPNTALSFAIYTPNPYTPLASGWTCPGCNGALSNRPATAAVFLTFLVMLVSGWRVLSGMRARA
ncbi:unnamed protein product [Mycena citricolor]|uniref:DUF7137 domain-containing protein n=1 Tax=Mycena citricolor TaxID=2018698 RepID=A0AAD2HPI9_9AGAR|nr:unnamed protein product [Mycena citricolor]CAK5281024.1 unnamed protein product [Mycena citricolor]